jgi:glutamate-1-semialdehyde 2,1-aminomutase
MAAGIASLRLLRETMPYDYLDNLGSTLSAGIKEIANEHSIPLQVPQVGSMYCLFFSEEPISNFEDALASDGESFKKLFKYCLDHGIYLPPSAYETCFISTAHQMGDIEKTLETIKRSFATF